MKILECKNILKYCKEFKLEISKITITHKRVDVYTERLIITKIESERQIAKYIVEDIERGKTYQYSRVTPLKRGIKEILEF